MNEQQVTENPEFKRWTAKRKTQVVLDLLKGKTTVAQICRQFDLTPSEVEGWIEEAQRGMENALRTHPRDLAEAYETRIKELQAKVGELLLQNDALKKLRRLADAEESS
jgi:transposase-like protein